jgi:hypothetical protein
LITSAGYTIAAFYRAVIQHAPANNLARLRDHLQDRSGGDAFPTARFANDAQRLSALDTSKETPSTARTIPARTSN